MLWLPRLKNLKLRLVSDMMIYREIVHIGNKTYMTEDALVDLLVDYSDFPLPGREVVSL